MIHVASEGRVIVPSPSRWRTSLSRAYLDTQPRSAIRLCFLGGLNFKTKSVDWFELGGVTIFYLAVASARTSLRTVTFISPGNVISSSTRLAMSRAILWAVASSASSALRITRTSRPA